MKYLPVYKRVNTGRSWGAKPRKDPSYGSRARRGDWGTLGRFSGMSSPSGGGGGRAYGSAFTGGQLLYALPGMGKKKRFRGVSPLAGALMGIRGGRRTPVRRTS